MDIVRLDQDITLAINGLHNDFSDVVWHAFSTSHIWIPLYLIIVVFIVWKAGWKKGLVYVAVIVLCFALCDQFATLIKNYVCRPRPCHEPFMLQNGLRLLEDAGGQYGFFSSHASNAFGLAVTSTQAVNAAYKRPQRWFSWLLYIWATLVSVSRIFVGKHYLGDILTGMLVGLVLGSVMASLGHWICSRLTDR